MYHHYTDRKLVDKHHRVYALLIGVLNQRLPQSHFTFVRDVETALVCLKANMSDN